MGRKKITLVKMSIVEWHDNPSDTYWMERLILRYFFFVVISNVETARRHCDSLGLTVMADALRLSVTWLRGKNDPHVCTCTPTRVRMHTSVHVNCAVEPCIGCVGTRIIHMYTLNGGCAKTSQRDGAWTVAAELIVGVEPQVSSDDGCSTPLPPPSLPHPPSIPTPIRYFHAHVQP